MTISRIICNEFYFQKKRINNVGCKERVCIFAPDFQGKFLEKYDRPWEFRV